MIQIETNNNIHTNSLKEYGDKVSISRSELVRLFGKRQKGVKCLFYNLEMVISNEDGSLTIVPFQLKINQIGNSEYYNFTKIIILATNCHWSQAIKRTLEKKVVEMRNDFSLNNF